MPIRFSQLFDAFQFTGPDSETYVDRQTGKTYLVSPSAGIDELDDEAPEDIESDRFLALPDRRDLGLGKPMALDFAQEHLPGDFDAVRAIFNRRGAFGRFKDLLVRRGVVDQWYAFSNAAEEAALRQWCADEGLAVEKEEGRTAVSGANSD